MNKYYKMNNISFKLLSNYLVNIKYNCLVYNNIPSNECDEWGSSVRLKDQLPFRNYINDNYVSGMQIVIVFEDMLNENFFDNSQQTIFMQLESENRLDKNIIMYFNIIDDSDCICYFKSKNLYDSFAKFVKTQPIYS